MEAATLRAMLFELVCPGRRHCTSCRNDGEWRRRYDAPEECPHGIVAGTPSVAAGVADAEKDVLRGLPLRRPLPVRPLLGPAAPETCSLETLRVRAQGCAQCPDSFIDPTQATLPICRLGGTPRFATVAEMRQFLVQRASGCPKAPPVWVAVPMPVLPFGPRPAGPAVPPSAATKSVTENVNAVCSDAERAARSASCLGCGEFGPADGENADRTTWTCRHADGPGIACPHSYADWLHKLHSRCPVSRWTRSPVKMAKPAEG